MIVDRNYRELYSSYPEAIEFMCFVTSENEFNDFVSDLEARDKAIDKEAFLLQLGLEYQ